MECNDVGIHIERESLFTYARMTPSQNENDESRIFAMLLILVLALLFRQSLAEEELRGVKHKTMRIRAGQTLFPAGILREKEEIKRKSKNIPFRQKTHTQVP